MYLQDRPSRMSRETMQLEGHRRTLSSASSKSDEAHTQIVFFLPTRAVVVFSLQNLLRNETHNISTEKLSLEPPPRQVLLVWVMLISDGQTPLNNSMDAISLYKFLQELARLTNLRFVYLINESLQVLFDFGNASEISRRSVFETRGHHLLEKSPSYDFRKMIGGCTTTIGYPNSLHLSISASSTISSALASTVYILCSASPNSSLIRSLEAKEDRQSCMTWPFMTIPKDFDSLSIRSELWKGRSTTQSYAHVHCQSITSMAKRNKVMKDPASTSYTGEQIVMCANECFCIQPPLALYRASGPSILANIASESAQFGLRNRIPPSMEDCFAAPAASYHKKPRCQQHNRSVQSNLSKKAEPSSKPTGAYVGISEPLPVVNPCRLNDAPEESYTKKKNSQLVLDKDRKDFLLSQSSKYPMLHVKNGPVCAFYIPPTRHEHNRIVSRRKSHDTSQDPTLRQPKRSRVNHDFKGLKPLYNDQIIKQQTSQCDQTVATRQFSHRLDSDPVKTLRRPFRKHILTARMFNRQLVAEMSESTVTTRQLEKHPWLGPSSPQRRASCLDPEVSASVSENGSSVAESHIAGDDPPFLKRKAEFQNCGRSYKPRTKFLRSSSSFAMSSATSSEEADTIHPDLSGTQIDISDNNLSRCSKRGPRSSFSSPTAKYPVLPVPANKIASDVCSSLSMPSVTAHPSTPNTIRPKGSFKPPLVTSKSVVHEVSEARVDTMSVHQRETSEQVFSVWQTAAGRRIDIERDPKLALEWLTLATDAPPSTLHQSPAQTSDDVSNSSSHQKHYGGFPSCSSGSRLIKERSVIDKEMSLQLHLRKLNEDINTMESALQVETRNEDPKLEALTSKWRSVAQEACDQVFARVAIKVEQCGGLREWNRLQQPKQWADFPDETRRNSSRQDEEEFVLTSEEKAAMDVDEDCYTMEMMLTQFGIPLSLIGRDADLGRWY